MDAGCSRHGEQFLPVWLQGHHPQTTKPQPLGIEQRHTCRWEDFLFCLTQRIGCHSSGVSGIQGHLGYRHQRPQRESRKPTVAVGDIILQSDFRILCIVNATILSQYAGSHMGTLSNVTHTGFPGSGTWCLARLPVFESHLHHFAICTTTADLLNGSLTQFPHL